jgi:hypothetical protein
MQAIVIAGAIVFAVILVFVGWFAHLGRSWNGNGGGYDGKRRR